MVNFCNHQEGPDQWLVLRTKATARQTLSSPTTRAAARETLSSPTTRAARQTWSRRRMEQRCGRNHLQHKFKVNIENPSQADFVNPQTGSIANLNSFKFSILEHIQLSVERGELHPNAIQSPHWIINAHNLLYVTEGALRVQIVDNQGNSVFDNELREGQVVVIPQNFAVIKRANEQGSRWVSFKTNDNAMISNLAGRVSAISSMPVDVVANAYQVSREEAQQLKFSQRETVLFAPSFSRGQGRASA
ncbi:putative 11-S seed storage protein, plant [Helianthus anomalus]